MKIDKKIAFVMIIIFLIITMVLIDTIRKYPVDPLIIDTTINFPWELNQPKDFRYIEWLAWQYIKIQPPEFWRLSSSERTEKIVHDTFAGVWW